MALNIKYMSRPKVAVLRLSSYRFKELKASITTLLKFINCSNIFENKNVLLKVNLNKGATEDKALNTHPEFVRAIIQIIKEQNGKPVVGDSSGMLGFTEEVFEASGMKRMLADESVQMVNFDAVKYYNYILQGKILNQIYLPDLLQKMDLLVTLPKLKTHDLLLFSGAIKNQMGLLPGASKCRLHRLAYSPERLAQALVDINKAVHFNLAIIDGISGLEAYNKPRRSEIIAASTDLVALDSVCSKIIGIDPMRVLTNSIGEREKLGVARLDSIDIIGEDISKCLINFKQKIFEIKKNILVSKAVFRIKGNLFKLSINKKECSKCNNCLNVCPVAAIDLKYLAIDRKKCIRCYSCYYNCPYNAIKMKSPWYLKPFIKKKIKELNLRITKHYS